MVVQNFPRLSETFLVNKFLGLLEKGIDVHVLCMSIDKKDMSLFPQLKNRPGVSSRIHRAPPHKPRWLAGLLAFRVFMRSLFINPAGTVRYLRTGYRRFGMRIFRKLYIDSELLVLRPHIVHFEFGAQALGRTHMKHSLGCKVVVSFRGYDLNYHGLENSDHYREVWEEADALHLLGEDLWQRAQRRGCPPDKPHFLIPPAIDTGFFDGTHRKDTADGKEHRPIRILSVGRLEWKKGYEFGLQAIQLLAGSGVDCEYHVVGDGSYLDVVTFAVHQLQLTGRTKLLRALSPAEVREEMLHAQIFLHAAVSEGFCNSVLEAQAMGLPVVCTDADGLRENVEDGVTGFVVRRRDAQALADKLAVLVKDPDLRHRMGKAGRKRVESSFRLADQISAFERLYSQLFSGAMSLPEAPTSSVNRAAPLVPREAP